MRSYCRKVNGVWRQTTLLNVAGDEDNYTLEPGEEATQELDIDRARQIIKARGCSKSKPGNLKRKERRAKRRAKRTGHME
jgi:hypothetical protein